MNEIWTIIEPYILTLVGALGGGSIIAVLASIVCKRIIRKASAAYDLNNFAAKVADKLCGKTIDIDISSIVDKRLTEIANELAEQVNIVAEETNSYKRILALMGDALAHLKMLTDEERAALIAAVKKLDNEYIPPEKEIVSTIKLEPIVTAQDQEKQDNTVNFG